MQPAEPQPASSPRRGLAKALPYIIVAIVIFLGAQFIVVLFLSVYAAILGKTEADIDYWLTSSVMGQFWIILLIELLTVGLLLWYMKHRKITLSDIGLVKPKLPDLGYALIGAVVYFPLLIFIFSVVDKFLPVVDLEQQQQIGFETASGRGLLAVFLSVVILPAVVEEFVARGFLYSGLKKHLPKLYAVLITSVLFALPHLEFGSDQPLLWAAAIDTFVLSLILIWLKDRTGRLWAPIGLHAIKNGAAFLYLFVFTR